MSATLQPLDTEAAETQGDYPAAGYAWYVVGVLYLAYVLSFVDRQILAFMVGPIRADLGISDFQFSLVHGLAFVIFYSVLGIPIARLADRSSRRTIVSLGVGLWSVMTALCGLANTFTHLFLARLGVGVGEASLSPSAISLIADYFPREKRTLPINIYSAGVHGGAGLANIFGGLIVGATLAGGTRHIAVLGEMHPWQLAFLIVGLPGLAVSLLMSTVREPARREKRRAGGAVKFSETLQYLKRHWLPYASMMLGAGFATLASYGAFSWVPATYARVYGWSSAQIGLWFGLITIVCGTGGLLLSGMITGIMTRKGRPASHLGMMAVCMAGAVPSAALMMAVHNPYRTLLCLSFLVFFMSAPIGLVQAALQAVTPNEMRAQMLAIYLLVATIVGGGLGPSAVAGVTDYYFRDDASVGTSIAIVAAVAAALSVFVLSLGANAYRHMVHTVQGDGK